MREKTEEKKKSFYPITGFSNPSLGNLALLLVCPLALSERFSTFSTPKRHMPRSEDARGLKLQRSAMP